MLVSYALKKFFFIPKVALLWSASLILSNGVCWLLREGTKPGIVCPSLLSKSVNLCVFNGKKGKYSKRVWSAQICGGILKTIAGTECF